MFKKLLNLFKTKTGSSQCNDLTDPTLLEVEEKIKNSSFNLTPASSDFQSRLKAKILEKRHQKWYMNLKQVFSLKSLVPVMASVVLVAVVVVALHFSGDKFAPLLIDSAYAHDNFDVVASDSDSIGIENNSFFTIKSKQAIDDVGNLSKNITLIPQTEFSLKKISAHEFKLTPKNVLANRQVYRIEIQSVYAAENGLTSSFNYSFAFQVKDTFKIISTLPANKGNGVPLNTGIEVLFSHENFSNFENNFSISPKVDGRFEKHYRTMVFIPNQPLQIGTVYTVKVGAGVSLDGSDKKLAQEKVFQFETIPPVNTKDQSQYMYFYNNQLQFGTNDQPVFTAFKYLDDGKGAPAVKVEMYAFQNPDQYVTYLKQRDSVPSWQSYSITAIKYDTSKLNLVSKYDDKMRFDNNTFYLQYPSKLPAGQYLAKFTHSFGTSYVFVQVSDLAAYTSVSTDKTLVWVNSLQTKKPVASARVLDELGKTDSVTGQDGTVVFPTVSNKKDYTVNYIKVSDNANTTILPTYSNDSYSSPFDKFWMYLYTDRALYQPTDDVNVWGFIKSRDNNLSASKNVKLKISSSQYWDYYSDPVVIVNQDVNVDKDGFYNAKMKLQNLVPGSYNLVLEVDGEAVQTRYFTVATYNKPLYKISIVHNKDVVFAGEKISFDIKTTFFDGTPVPNTALQYNAGAINANNVKIQTDEKGSVHLDFDAVRNTYDPSSFDLTVSPVDSEVGDISAYDNVMVYSSRAQFYSPSTTVDQNIGTSSARIKIQTKAVDLSKINEGYLGANLGNVPVAININEISYVAKETGNYYDFINKVSHKTFSYDRVSKALPVINLKTDVSGSGWVDFNILPQKTYELTLVLQDGHGGNYTTNLMMYASKEVMEMVEGDGSQYVGYNLADKSNNGNAGIYKVGQVVSLEFQRNNKSFDGNNFLFYRNHLGLNDYKVQTDAIYNFNFSAENIPNVFVSGVWFDGHSYHSAGNINLVYDRNESELKIKVSTDKKKYKPGEEVKLTVNVQDKNGDPVSTNVNVDLVDAALANIGGKDAADPLGALYSLVGSGELTTAQTHDTPVVNTGGGAERGGCFLGGTKIKMADGTQKNIEDIKIGDKISTFKSETDHTFVSAQVEETFRHIVKGYLVINNQLYVTSEHRIFINNSWRQIGEAKIGDVMLGVNGNPVKIFSIDKRDATVVVYNFKVKDLHTYLANGIYVHNDKGGVRDYFPDIALFQSVKTNSSGNGEITFKLPDNITSWMVTAQGISADFGAGVGTMDLPVSLPMFVDQTLPSELLSADKAFGRLRAYGDAMSANNDVNFSTTIDGLGFNNAQSGKAFVANYFALPQFKVGDYRVTTKAESAQYKDAVAHTIKVVDSRLMTGVQKFYDLKEALKVESNPNGLTTLTFTDNNQGKYYYSLLNLLWNGGSRVDQRLSSAVSADLINQYFKDKIDKVPFDGKLYQEDAGGIKLLTYSEADLELSAKVAALNPSYFDRFALTNYFYTFVNKKDLNQDEAVRALYGLASLNEPVLISIQNLAKLNNLTILNKLYLGLAAEQLGDAGLARKLYDEVVKNNGEQMAPYARINVDKNEDLSVNATVLAAVLGAGLDDKNHDAFWQYAKDRGTKDILINFEEVLYIKQNLPHLTAGDSSFSLDFDGQHLDEKLARGESISLKLYPNQIASLKFSNIKGDVAVVSSFDQKVDNTKNSSKYLSIARTYLVGGKETNTFTQGDIVEIRIVPKYEPGSLNNSYQITDLLPSGFTILTNLYTRGMGYNCDSLYPIEINGQKNKFLMYSGQTGCGSGLYHYYARVVMPGEFKAEPAVLESVASASQKAFSTEGMVTITQ